MTIHADLNAARARATDALEASPLYAREGNRWMRTSVNLAELLLAIIPEAERARSLTPEVREGLRWAGQEAAAHRRHMNAATTPSDRAALDWIEEHAGERSDG